AGGAVAGSGAFGSGVGSVKRESAIYAIRIAGASKRDLWRGDAVVAWARYIRLGSSGMTAVRSKAPWSIERGLEPVLSRWLASDWVRPCLCADETRAARTGSLAPIPEGL